MQGLSNQYKLQNITAKISGVVPTRDGYTFVGWAKNSSSTTVAYYSNASYTANAPIKLFALWKAKANVQVSTFTPITAQQDYITGKLETSTSEKLYSFTPQNTGVYTFYTSSNSGPSTYANVYSDTLTDTNGALYNDKEMKTLIIERDNIASGTQTQAYTDLKLNMDNGAGWKNYNFSLTAYLEKGRTYYLKVKPGLTKRSCTYRLYVKSYAASNELGYFYAGEKGASISTKISSENGCIVLNKEHNGYDVAGANNGFPLYAIWDGTVAEIGKQGNASDAGNYIKFKYTNPITGKDEYVRYLHLQEPPKKSDGTLYKDKDIVHKGDLVGITGGTGSYKMADGTIAGYAPHLHFDIREVLTDERVDPHAYFEMSMTYDS